MKFDHFENQDECISNFLPVLKFDHSEKTRWEMVFFSVLIFDHFENQDECISNFLPVLKFDHSEKTRWEMDFFPVLIFDHSEKSRWVYF